MKSISKLLTTIVLLFLYGCSSTPNAGSERSAAELAEEQTIHDIDKLLEDLPPPSLVPFTLKSIGAEFNRDLIHEIDNVDAYKDNSDKMALVMGVFASDISYLAAYGHEEDCINYLKASHMLAENLGDSAIYDQSQLDEFKGHIKDQNEEEISKLLSKLFLSTSVQMEEDHHLTMAGLALTGSFVEGLYQALLTIETFPDTRENEKLLEPLVKIVIEEEQALQDIITVLKDLPFDKTIAEMTIELSILDKIYKGDMQEIEENMKSDPNFILTRDAVRDITIELKRIRRDIIE